MRTPTATATGCVAAIGIWIVLTLRILGIHGDPSVQGKAEEALNQKGLQKLRLLKEDIGALLEESRSTQSQTTEDKGRESNHSQSDEPEIDVYNFLKEVAKQQDTKINRKFLVYLHDLPVKDPINLHLAKLAVLVRKLGLVAATSRNDDKDALVRAARQADSVDSLDAAIERLRADAEKRRAPRRDAGKELGEVPGMVLSFLDLLERKPTEMMNVVLSIVFSKTSMSKETSQMVTMGFKMFPKTRYFQVCVDLARTVVLGVAETPLGRKLFELAPALAETNDIQELLALVKSEMNVDMRHISKLMVHPHVKETVLDKSARALSATVILFQTFIMDKTKAIVLNTFLASQGLPTINPKKFIATGLRFLEKVLRSFTRWELDFKFGEELIIDHLRRFEKKGVTWDTFGTFEKEARFRLMSDFIVETFGETLGALVEAQYAIFNKTPGPECAEFLLCHISAKANQTESYSGLQKYASKAMSLVSAWSWGLDKQINTLNMYNAVFHGTNKQNCDVKYGQNVNNVCKIFPWMHLDAVEHVHSEL